MEEIITLINRQKQLDRSEERVKPGNLQEYEKHEQFMIGFYLYAYVTQKSNRTKLKASSGTYSYKQGTNALVFER